MDQTEELYGKIMMRSIVNTFNGVHLNDEDLSHGPLLTARCVKPVHYPDSQQLVLWLPDSGRLYTSIVIADETGGDVVYNKEINDILNGSIQLIIDTLFLHPGDFTVSIRKANGLEHIIYLKKFPVGEEPPVEIVQDFPVPDGDKGPIQYRDGFGNIIPNEDLILRDEVIEKMHARFSRRVEFEGTVRSGTVKYIEGSRSLQFYSEMGGGDCIFYIDIPTSEKWEASTGFKLSEREEIVKFVAEEAVRQQTSSPGIYYLIGERDIVIMNG